jgi:predicted RNA-binding Zn ribbon-like protein
MRLASAAELAALPVHLGIARSIPDIREEQLTAAVVLRDALRRSFLRASRGETLELRDVATVNSFAADEPPAVSLTPAGDMVRVAIDPLAGALAEIARDAVALIANCSQRLRVCERNGCDTIFVDLSRSGRRRWCSMQRCGNREKVAGYRRRQK